MSAVDDIKSRLDLPQIAQLLGVDEQAASTAVDQALSQLVGAMDSNATNPEAALGLTRAALSDHLTSAPSGDAVDLRQVDAADGEKIVSHVLSADQIQTLSSSSEGGLLKRLLPLLAPIVMGYVASKIQERLGGAATQQTQTSSTSGGLGDLLGGLLGGSSSSGGLGDLLGGLLGGGGSSSGTTASSAEATGGTGGFQTPQGAGSGLRIDTEGASTTTPSQSTSGGAGDLLGSLLQEILLGRR